MDSQNIPAGWYPDSSNPAQQRWWDGTAWTESVQQAIPVASPYSAEPGASTSTATGTWQVWAINALFALQLIVSLAYIATVDWSAYLAYSADPTPGDVDAFFSIFNGWYVATLLVSFVGYAGGILLAYLDGRELAARGISRPFHWALSFIPSYGTTVYIIGRSVVVRRRTGGGLAPLWAFIALFIVGIIASLIASVGMMNSMFSEIQTLSTY